MTSIRALVILFACVAGAGALHAQTPVYLNTVAPGMTTNSTLGSSDEVYARGFWNVGDGGGGWFTPNGTGCTKIESNVSYGSGSNIVHFTLGTTAGIAVGMGVTGSNINPGNYVTALTLTTITLFQNPTGPGTSINVSGGNGGTIIGDASGNCFNRVQPNYDLHQWGARCDVQVPNSTITYDPSVSTNYATVFPPLPAVPAAGAIIMIPGIGAGSYSAMGQVANGSNLNSGGMNYSAGDTIIFNDSGGTETQQVEIAVDTTMTVGLTMGVINAWHFVAYGNFSVLPTTTGGTMAQLSSSGPGTGAILAPIWSGATYVGKIASGSTTTQINFDTMGALPSITLVRTVNSGWYFGDDDSANINNAIATLAPSGATQLILPGNCGAGAQINGVDANGNGPALVGTGAATSGLYALAAFAGNIYNRSSAAAQQSGGGGLRNMAVDALGGVSPGYMVSGGTTGGAVVEVDGGKGQIYSGLEIRNATGAGNSVFQCGSRTDSNANAGGNWYQNIHAFTDQSLFSGAQFPDADIYPTANCHDSFFAKPIAVNATIANILHVDGGALHIENPHTFNALYPDVPGSADYGIATSQHDYILGPQLDDGQFANLFLAPAGNFAGNGQRVVEAWIDCAALKNIGVPPAFTLNTTGNAGGTVRICPSVS